MNERFVPLLIFTAIILLIDVYSFFGMHFLMEEWGDVRKKIAYGLYVALSLATVVMMISFAFMQNPSDIPGWVRVGVIAPLFLLVFAKLVFGIFLLVADLIRGAGWVFANVFSTAPYDASRSDFITKMGLLAAGTLFGSMIYGIAKGAYNYTVHRNKISFNNLPDVFEGFRIVQLSDMHLGSFLTERPLEKAVAMVNDLKPDLILFTGDLVNNIQPETTPFFDTLKKLKATHGVYSVLGNHDYGDYVRWPSDQDKRNNLRDLMHTQQQMGWRLLMDEHVRIQKEGEFINLIGIQNWGAKGRFPKYGDLAKATRDLDISRPSILMSHDPSHWKAQVTTSDYSFIDLTLSGHTHGMQFGVEIPGWIKWSPVKYMYEQWAGLYEHEGQRLYVNRGLGFLGYPGRVGISPEITLIELQKS